MNQVRIVSILALAALCALPVSAQDIKIGFPGPLTGPVQFLGQHMKWGAEQAVDEINRKGGVLGRRISFVMQDSVCRPADSVAATERLLSQDKVDLVLGDLSPAPAWR